MIQLKTALALSVAAVLGSTVLTLSASTPPATAAVTCQPVAIVAFRGSGEKNLAPTAATLAGASHNYAGTALTTNGWEGQTLQRILTAYVSSTRTSSWPVGFRPDQVPVLGVGFNAATGAGYPAIDIASNVDVLNPMAIFGKLVKSSAAGAPEAEGMIHRFLAAEPAGCNTKFIAIGYSQGAMDARDLAQLDLGLVHGVEDFGDPVQKPNAPGNEGTAVNGDGVVRWWVGTQTDSFYKLGDAATALCHANDPICSYSWLFGLAQIVRPGGLAQHQNYGAAAVEAGQQGQQLANLAATYAKAGGTAAAPQSAAPSTNVATAPQAQLTSAGPYVAGIPVPFSASASSGSGPLAYSFDVRGRGTAQSTGSDTSFTYTYPAAGIYTAAVTVTDAHGRTSTSSQAVTVVDPASLRQLPNPTDPSTALDGVTLSSNTRSTGRSVRLTVPGIEPAGTLVGARLVRPSATAWLDEPAAVYGAWTPAAAAAGQTITVTAGAGDYQLLVFTDTGKHATVPLTVYCGRRLPDTSTHAWSAAQGADTGCKVRVDSH